MRIISQDGMIDLPYEQAIINVDYRNKNKIVACGVGCDGENSVFHIADYSTEAKARKAMEILRNVYYDSEYTRTYNVGVLTTHFQFPQDDELNGAHE